MVRSPVAPLTRRDAANGMAVLSELAQERLERRDRYRELSLPDDFDETPDSPCPIYDLFFETSQAHGIHDMTNLMPAEFDALWRAFAREVTVGWARHRGQRSSFFAKDMFFMTLAVLKNAGKWSTMAAVFRIKTPTFQKAVTKFIKLLSPILYELYVAGVSDEHTMDRVTTTGRGFQNYWCGNQSSDTKIDFTNRSGHGARMPYLLRTLRPWSDSSVCAACSKPSCCSDRAAIFKLTNARQETYHS